MKRKEVQKKNINHRRHKKTQSLMAFNYSSCQQKMLIGKVLLAEYFRELQNIQTFKSLSIVYAMCWSSKPSSWMDLSFSLSRPSYERGQIVIFNWSQDCLPSPQHGWIEWQIQFIWYAAFASMPWKFSNFDRCNHKRVRAGLSEPGGWGATATTNFLNFVNSDRCQ